MNRLAFAILMKARQAYGLFVHPDALSETIVAHVAEQLVLPVPSLVVTSRLGLHCYRSAIRTHIGGALYDKAAQELVETTTTHAAATMSDPADLINRAIEALFNAIFLLL